MAVNTLKFANVLSTAKGYAAQANEALSKVAVNVAGAKDPTEQGNPGDPPVQPHGSRAENGLPPVPTNENNGTTPGANLTVVSDPAGVGQGTYPAVVDGTAADAKVNKPTAPIKAAGDGMEQIRALRDSFSKESSAPVTEQGKKPEEGKKQAANFIPDSLKDVPDVKEKLAFVGAAMLSSDYGQQAVLEVLEREQGAQETRDFAAGIVANMAEYEKMAASQAQPSSDAFTKMAAACRDKHFSILDTYDTYFEKMAYANGAVDAQSDMENEGAPEEGELSDEDIVTVLAQAVESGELPPEAAEQLIQQFQGDQAETISAEELAQYLIAGVEQGLISQEQAQAILTDIVGADEGGEEGAPAGAPAPTEAPAAPQETPSKEAAASIVDSLFANK